MFNRPICHDKNSLTTLLLFEHRKIFIERPIVIELPSMAVCLAFFNAFNYKRPIMNCLFVINELKKQNIPIFVIESKINNNELILNCIPKIFYFSVETNVPNFSLKERLYNILVFKKMPRFKYLTFVDGDIIFDSHEWFNKTIKKLEEVDVVQPFEYCKWLTSSCDVTKYEKVSMAGAHVCTKKHEILKDMNCFDSYHFGFAWSMKTTFFYKIRGFFDMCIDGSGDTVTGLTFLKGVKNLQITNMIQLYSSNNTFLSQLFLEYYENKHFDSVSVSYVKDIEIYHLWHGHVGNRKYKDKFALIWGQKSTQYYIEFNSDGVVTIKEGPLKEYIYENFSSRKEDDDTLRIV